MATKKTFFNTVFCTLTNKCDIKPSMLARGDLLEATVRALRSRGIPKQETYDWLIESLKEALSTTSVDREALQNAIDDVWVDAPTWHKGESVADYAVRLLDEAYRLSKGGIAQETPTEKKRLIVFGLNGTLLKGVRYSWELAYRAAGLNWRKCSEARKNQFEDGNLSYEDWCEEDCRVLREAGLTREKLIETVRNSELRCIGNLKEAILEIKAHGHKVAVISGGIDTVLYAMIDKEEADKLFDQVFINKFVYDENGLLKKIIPTTYDWDTYSSGVEGKQAGFKRLCERYGFHRKDSAFAGDDLNDMGAMKAAGMKIYTYSYSKKDPCRGSSRRPEIRPVTPHDAIMEPGDDLMRIAKRFIDWDFGDMP